MGKYYTGKIRIENNKNGMIHYHWDLGRLDGVCCCSQNKITLRNGNFEFVLSKNREGYHAWNQTGFQLQFKTWDFKINENVEIGKRNCSQYNSFEHDYNIRIPDDFDRMIKGLKELKRIVFPNHLNENQ